MCRADSADELLEAPGQRGSSTQEQSASALPDKGPVLLDPDVMAMALALDTMWAGSGSSSKDLPDGSNAAGDGLH